MFSSIINVLKVEREERIGKASGKAYNHFAARVILLDDGGDVLTVGVINSRRISPELRDTIAPGTYRATFALQVPDYGDDKGDVIAVVTALTPHQVKVGRQPAAAAT